jgi:hypothetical protein
MPKNPGNTGHRGYKMSKVTAIEAVNGHIAITLECGHINWCYPYSGYTAQEWVGRLQRGPGAFMIGKTRVRCHQRHE